MSSAFTYQLSDDPAEMGPLRGWCDQHLPGYRFGGGFCDGTAEVLRDPPARRAAGELVRSLGDGDVLLVGSLQDVLCGRPDPAAFVRLLAERGVRLIALEPAFDLAGEELEGLVGGMGLLMEAIVEMEWTARSEYMRESIARRRQAGLATARNHMGYIVTGPKGKRRRNKDNYVWKWAAKIVELHDVEKLSFRQIAKHLKDNKVAFRSGGEWHTQRVWRVYHWYKQQQAQGPAAS